MGIKEQEIWKDIIGYEGLYQISNHGRVKSFKKLHKKLCNNPIMSSHIRDGYEIIGLSKENKTRTHSIHRLVALHFVPNPQGLPYVYHIDGNKLNNRYDNLIWLWRKNLVLGIGMNDVIGIFSKENKEHTVYKMWEGMISRCYDERNRWKHPTYHDCEMCEDWITFSNFKKWFDDPINGYKKGYQLDKDILVKGNRLYSPETCCFVPQELNKLLTKNNKHRGKYPIGVEVEKSGRYRAKIQPNGKVISLGTYETVELAFNAYKAAKEKRIRELAKEYKEKNMITNRVYEALMSYQVDITD